MGTEKITVEDSQRFKRILVVDDERSQLFLLATRLTEAGFEVTSCQDSSEALTILQSDRYTVAILDERMPGLSGIELLHQIRDLDISVEVIVYTGFGSYESAKDAVNLGAFAYIEKLGSYTELINYAHRACYKQLIQYSEMLEATVQDRTRELHESEKRAQVTLHSIGDAIITADVHGLVDYLNPIAAKVVGCDADKVLGQPVHDIYKAKHESAKQSIDSIVEQCIQSGAAITRLHELTLTRQDGNTINIEDSIAPIVDNGSRVMGVAIVFRDVTETRQLTRKISHQASHDYLTGLLNRREFENQLVHALMNINNLGTEYSMLYMDLDQFKIINDLSGHIVGDFLLRQISLLLRDKVRKQDILARLGGDEFGILLKDCSAHEALSVAEEIHDSIRNFRFVWQEQTFVIGASIGLVPISEVEQSMSSIMRIADSTCYAAKEAGRNRIYIYSDNDAVLAKRHGEIQWVTRIADGLEHNDFVLAKQRIIRTDSKGPPKVLFEVLLRMRDKSGQLIMPDVFIPAAERYDMMPKIDRWVIRSVCEWLSTDASVLQELDLCFINLSGQTLNDLSFADFVISEFARKDLPLSQICFEITETAAVADLNGARHFLSKLRREGAKIALDDFGSGLSSFAYLKHLPVDFLKIDGVFVRDIVKDPIDYAMVKSINEIGQIMGMQTIAEFVETDAILSKVQDIGIDFAQGFGISECALIQSTLPFVAESEVC